MSDNHDSLIAELEAAAVSLEATLERRRAIREQIRERTRQLRIDSGLPADPPKKSLDELRAETIAMRAENDQREAERSGAWRTYD